MSLFFTMIGNIVVAKFLTPKELGSFSVYLILVNYIVLVQMGIPNGLSRQFPFYIGGNNQDKANIIAGTSKTFVIFMSALIFILTLIFILIKWLNHDYFSAMGYAVVGISVIQTLYITKYLKLLYRSNLDFGKLAKIELINSFLNFICIYFIYVYGIWGLGIRIFLIFITDWIMSQLWVPHKIVMHWDKHIFLELLKIGAPIFFVSTVFSIWPIIQRTFIYENHGETALGLFSIAVAVQTAMSVITSSASSMIFPKIATMYGEGKTKLEILKFNLKQDFMVFFLNLGIAMIGYFSIPFLVRHYLPNYSSVISTCLYFLLLGVISSFSSFSNFYQMFKLNQIRLISFVLGIGIWAVVIFYFENKFSQKLIIFPIAMIFGQIAMYFFDVIYVFTLLKRESEKVNFI